ncbi:MAG: lipopolysaccharide biosynthesis protein [Chloroflexi bacterium]|jgi:uncharacterized protein involved in exopolysaccharide biosynthesis|nr:lipopolysaccharide biosynthesis protein [Chloroflexota bacterium]
MFKLVALRLLESYFRHRWLYLLPIVLMTAAGVVFLLVDKPKYAAKGVVYVQAESFLAALNSIGPENTNWWSTPAQATANDVNELLQTDAFIRAVIQNTDLEKEMDGGPQVVEDVIEATRKNLWAVPLGESQVQINAAHEDPVIASQLANAVIQGYVQWKINSQRAESEAAQAFFSQLIVAYKAELDTAHQKLVDYLTAHPEPLRGERPVVEQIEIRRLENEIDMIAARYTSAVEKEEDAQLAMAQIESDTSQSYVLIDAPKVPMKPDRSKKKLAMTLGIFVASGGLLSLIAVAGGALLDRTFRFPLDVQNWTGLPVLAVVPDLSQPARRRFWRRKRPDKQAAREDEPLLPPNAEAALSYTQEAGKQANPVP